MACGDGTLALARGGLVERRKDEEAVSRGKGARAARELEGWRRGARGGRGAPGARLCAAALVVKELDGGQAVALLLDRSRRPAPACSRADAHARHPLRVHLERHIKPPDSLVQGLTETCSDPSESRPPRPPRRASPDLISSLPLPPTTHHVVPLNLRPPRRARPHPADTLPGPQGLACVPSFLLAPVVVVHQVSRVGVTRGAASGRSSRVGGAWTVKERLGGQRGPRAARARRAAMTSETAGSSRTRESTAAVRQRARPRSWTRVCEPWACGFERLLRSAQCRRREVPRSGSRGVCRAQLRGARAILLAHCARLSKSASSCPLVSLLSNPPLLPPR